MLQKMLERPLKMGWEKLRKAAYSRNILGKTLVK